MAHVPPTHFDCHNAWVKHFTALTKRFQHIVRLTMHGHKHSEYYGLMRTPGDLNSSAFGVHYMTGSVTTYEAVFPTFRLYHLDKETMLPVKIDTYKFDITAEQPKWTFDHAVPDYFDMDDLSPRSFDALADNILKNETLAIRY